MAVHPGTERRSAAVEEGEIELPSFDFDDGRFHSLRAAFRAWFPDFQRFDAPGERYTEGERRYKEELVARFRERFGDLDPAGAPDAAAAGRVVGRVLEVLSEPLPSLDRPQNLLSRRYVQAVRGLDEAERVVFAAAFVDLLRGPGASAERVERFNRAVRDVIAPRLEAWPAFSRSVPTLFLFLQDPDEEIYVRTRVFNAVARELTGEALFGERELDADGYRRALGFARAVRSRLRDWGWRPRDMIDVQGFLWVACGSDADPDAGGDEGPDLEPRPDRRIVKVSPGADARAWDACREHGYVVIGCDGLGDLRGYDDRDAVQAALAEANPEKPAGAVAAEADQVWTFRQLRPGDIVVANRGATEVLAVGEVRSPGYQYRPDRSAHRHAVPVRWDLSRARTVPDQGGRWERAVAELTPEHYAALFFSTPSDALVRALEAQGLHFPPEVVASYLLALQTKRFVILTGISGTGKTQLALRVAEHFAPREHRRVVAVRPDWTDNRGLLGYHNPITGRYVVTPFLRLLLRARAEADAARREGRIAEPFFVVLDEMNLARVEHYFSDFLSALESGEPLHLHDGAAVDAEDGDGTVPPTLAVPPNLFFTGTVNVDETTYMFSPKVLDRAFIIELNQVDLRGYLADGGTADGPEDTLRSVRMPRTLEGARRPGAADWRAFGELAGGELRRIVVELNELLAAEGRHFGYRVANEIARFVTLAADQAGSEPGVLRAALDLAILEKVLPKFHGTQQELEDVLLRLFAFAVTGTTDGAGPRPAEDPLDGGWTVRGGRLASAGAAEDDDAPAPALPRTAAKVWRMLRRLRQQGFTSFIE